MPGIDDRPPDRDTIVGWLLGLDDRPERSWWQGVRRVPEGHFLAFRRGEAERLQDYRSEPAPETAGGELGGWAGDVAVIDDGSQAADRLADELRRAGAGLRVERIPHPRLEGGVGHGEGEAGWLPHLGHPGEAAFFASLAENGFESAVTPVRIAPAAADLDRPPAWIPAETAGELALPARLAAAAERPVATAVYPGVPRGVPLASCLEWLAELAAETRLELVHPLLERPGEPAPGSPATTAPAPEAPQLARLGLVDEERLAEGPLDADLARRLAAVERWLADGSAG